MTEWISIKDKKPIEFGVYIVACLAKQDEKAVAVYINYGNTDVAYWDGNNFTPVSFDLTCHNRMHVVVHYNVSHWMPLPKPPGK